MKKYFLLVLAGILLYIQSPSQQITVSGKVLSAEGAAIAGATITVKSNNKPATTANNNGEFTLRNMAIGDTLMVSATGYETLAWPVVNKEVMMITLIPNVKLMQELVVNTGYEQVLKERATGSFKKVTSGLLNQQVSTSVLNRLEGIVPGMYYNQKVGASGLQVRGPGTILGQGDPLVILDNFPYEGNISNINPNDMKV